MFFGFALLAVTYLLLDAGLTKRSILGVLNNEAHGSGVAVTSDTNSSSGATIASITGTQSAADSIGEARAGLAAAGTTEYDGHPVADWIIPILMYGKSHGWTGTVSSGWRSDAEQKAIYDSGVRPAAVPRSEGGAGSNHEGTVFPEGAVDVTNASQLSQILMASKYANILVWAGSKDPVHFSHPHNGSY